MTFNEFHLVQEIYDGLDSIGFESPTPIQEQAIPIILEGKDLIACAQTGTGKTAAFLLPILHKIVLNGHNSINTLVIVPTRELALQIDESIQAFAYFTRASSIAVYGGNDGIMFEQEKKHCVKVPILLLPHREDCFRISVKAMATLIIYNILF